MAVLVIHGGAGRASVPKRQDKIARALDRISAAAYALLVDGETALDAAIDAVRRLEDDPLFNAGTGAKLQEDGVARLSASLMCGQTERFSGVVSVQHLANPILLCRPLLDEDARVLGGAGALARARELGLEEKELRTARSIAAWEKGLAGRTGTVGAVALDNDGRLAAATSTGGRGMERVGRISDSCTPAGNFATDRAAVSCTGVGEDILSGAWRPASSRASTSATTSRRPQSGSRSGCACASGRRASSPSTTGVGGLPASRQGR